MGTSQEILVLLICALLPRFEQKCLTFCTQPLSTGKLLMHYSCNGSINLPTPISPPAACQDTDSSKDCAGGLHSLSLHCPCMPLHHHC